MEKIITIITIVLHLLVIGSETFIHKDGCIYNQHRALVNCRDEYWSSIPFNYFKDKHFRTLDLGVNGITSLNDTSRFIELPSKDLIEKIYLDNNNISEVPRHLFDALSNLRVLDLSNNSLKHVPRNFCHITSLTDLVLDGNPIQTISKNAFVCLRNLKFLSLANCKIKNLPVDFLKDSNLEELNLVGNAIENIDEVNFPPNLRIIGISSDANSK